MNVTSTEPEPTPPDALSRTAALVIAAGRIGIGIGALAFTRPGLELAGFDEPSPATVVLARMAGVRDLALGVHTVLVRDDAAALGKAMMLTAAADGGDTLAFAAPLLGRDGIDRAVAKNLPIAAAATIVGGWLAARLRR